MAARRSALEALREQVARLEAYVDEGGLFDANATLFTRLAEAL